MARILVAEDNASVRDYVERGLKGFGHTVTTAADGGEALALVDGHDFDLLLTDIVMPVMDGIALALAVAERKPGLPIVMMSGYTIERERAHKLDALITEVLSKPFTLNELRMAVDRVLVVG